MLRTANLARARCDTRGQYSCAMVDVSFLDLPAPVLGKIVKLLADEGAVHLLPLCLVSTACAALAGDGARLAVARRGDAAKSSRSPKNKGLEWVRLLYELQMLASPVFTRATVTVDIDWPKLSGSQASGSRGAAICGAVPMVTGVHYVEFAIAEQDTWSGCQLGVVSAEQVTLSDSAMDRLAPPATLPESGETLASTSINYWMCDSDSGDLVTNNEEWIEQYCRWAGQEEFSTGDRVGLLLDLGNSKPSVPGCTKHAAESCTLAIYQDDERLGMMIQPDQGLKPPLYWCVRFLSGQTGVRIIGKAAPEVTAADLQEDERKREAVYDRRLRHALGNFSDDNSDDYV